MIRSSLPNGQRAFRCARCGAQARTSSSCRGGSRRPAPACDERRWTVGERPGHPRIAREPRTSLIDEPQRQADGRRARWRGGHDDGGLARQSHGESKAPSAALAGAAGLPIASATVAPPAAPPAEPAPVVQAPAPIAPPRNRPSRTQRCPTGRGPQGRSASHAEREQHRTEEAAARNQQASRGSSRRRGPRPQGSSGAAAGRPVLTRSRLRDLALRDDDYNLPSLSGLPSASCRTISSCR